MVFQIRFKVGSRTFTSVARVEMLTVGRELLIGRTVNTNAHWVGRRLALMGTMLSRVTTVDDNLRDISGAVTEAIRRRPDFLVVVGGLGPTPDDMTLKGVSLGLHRRLKLDTRALSLIREHYERMGSGSVEITPSRRKMAILPSGSTPLKNENGTAPGVRFECKGTVGFCLPGVPLEMKGIFRTAVEGEVKRKVGRLWRVAARLKVEGVYESALAPLIRKELRRNPGVYIKSHPRGTKEGTSLMELDVVSVKASRADAEKVATSVAGSMARQMTEAGGRITAWTGAGSAEKA